MQNSKLLKILAAIAAVAALSVSFAGCSAQNGLSAYEIAVENGFTGTEEEWLESLEGEDGNDGQNGEDGAGIEDITYSYEYSAEDGCYYTIIVFHLTDGTTKEVKIPGGEGNADQPSESIFLNKAAEYSTGYSDADGGVAEIVQYNEDNDKLYLVNGHTGSVDIVSVELYGDGELETNFNEASDRIDMRTLIGENSERFAEGFEYGDVTSVAINAERDVIALAVQHSDYAENGAIVILDYDGKFVAAYEAGVQPDMVTFAGDIALSANEGEPREGYGEGTTDPMGSVTAVDLSAETPVSKTITFESYDARRDELVAGKVLLKKDTAPSVDLEPEYIAVSGGYAYVALQEANAIATLDLETLTFISVKGLGFKDHSAEGNGLDLLEDGAADIQTQDVYGVYMPDGLATFTAGGNTYLVTANEGDAREWGDYADIEEYMIGGTDVDVLINSEFDGLEDGRHYLLGARSFSVWDVEDMSLVFDSGDMIESYIAESEEYAPYFNCSNDDVELDSRSKKKGPEPEAVNVQQIDGKIYAFVALERQGGVMMFDITDFENVSVVSYANSRDYSGDMLGDVAPESIDFISAADSLNGKNLLVVANENSGTIALYAMENEEKTYTMHSNFTEAPEEPVTPADHLIIWSVFGNGGKDDGATSNDFIAIKNPTGSDVDLTGFTVRYSAEGDGERVWIEIPLEGTLKAGEMFVIIGKDTGNGAPAIAFADGEYNIKVDELEIDNKHYSVELCDASDNTVDALGVTDSGEEEFGEGTLVSGINKHSVVVRVNDGDSGDNSADFEVVDFDDIENVSDYKPVAGGMSD